MLCLLRQDTNAATRYFKAVTDASAQAEYPTERRTAKGEITVAYYDKKTVTVK